MQYFDGRICIWRTRGDRTLPACIRYWHRSHAHGVMVLTATGYMTLISLVQIEGNLNADQYTSDILRPVVFPYFGGLPNAISQQDNAKPLVARHV